MCLVIDTCCLAAVFDGENEHHQKFEPVLRWITSRGRMIYGGTKYNSELGRARKYLPYVAELSRQRKTIQIPTATVDLIAAQLKRKFDEASFNDEHIIALVIASRCGVVCTDDHDAISYLKREEIFKGYPGASRPQIFRGHKSHKKLCCNKNILGLCRPR